MKRMSSPAWACLPLALALCGGAAAQTAVFDPVVQQARRIQLFAFAEVQGQDGRTASDSINRLQQRAPDASFFGDYSVTDTLVFDVAAPDGTASAHMESVQSQSSSFTAERIAFEGRIDGFATTSGTPGPLTTGFVGTNGEQGSSGDGDFFGTIFEVHVPVTVVLTMDALVTGGGSAVFMLNAQSGAFRQLVFETASDLSPLGSVFDSRQIVLDLQPGRYDVTADLTAAIGLDSRGSFTAGFTLVALPVAAVPEADVGALLLVGLPVIGVLARRTRRPHGDARVENR